jgi:hypothetical protein
MVECNVPVLDLRSAKLWEVESLVYAWLPKVQPGGTPSLSSIYS